MLVTIQIGVLFPQNFSVAGRAGTRVDIPAHEVLREGDDLTSMSDTTLIRRVESYLDLPENAMNQMIVQRPEEGNILITAKTRFGGVYYLTVDSDQIDEVLNWAVEAENKGGSKFPGMTYEQGVRAAIDWLVGNTSDRPDAD